jgi:hypothetical protein
MPANNNAELRDQFRVLMALPPMADYVTDAVVTARLGKMFADQANERARLLLNRGTSPT